MSPSVINDPGLDTQGWPGDVLDRKRIAEFLTRSLTEQARILTQSSNTGLTVALDADWGSGKSFFVKHWATDLRAQGHPVVVFDAWENDIGDEAAVALMACIKVELEKWNEKLPKKEVVRRKAAETTRDAIKGLRRAIAPASKVIAAAVLKKATGIAVDEVFDAYSKDQGESTNDISDAAASTLEAGLDELFKRALDDHQKRNLAITNFKTSISSLIELLEAEAEASIPVFVFVDEVDRCRPTYAIKLLEEIKHIFGAPKMCFVVSTNLAQLRESVCAIYGTGFDGHRYLKRFFDHQYTLPDPDNESFAAQLLAAESAVSARTIVHGLPASPGTPSTKRAIATISTAFGLDLRSQKQVFAMATSVAAAIPKERSVFVLWLFFLCALQHKQPQLFDRLLKNRVDHVKFKEICDDALQRDLEIEYSQPRESVERTLSRSSSAKLSEVMWSYYEWSFDDLIKLRDRDSNTNSYSYPASNLRAISEESPNPYNPTTKYPASIASYAEWVKYAGLAY